MSISSLCGHTRARISFNSKMVVSQSVSFENWGRVLFIILMIAFSSLASFSSSLLLCVACTVCTGLGEAVRGCDVGDSFGVGDRPRVVIIGFWDIVGDCDRDRCRCGLVPVGLFQYVCAPKALASCCFAMCL